MRYIRNFLVLITLAASLAANAQEKIINPDISYNGTPRSLVVGGLAVSDLEGYEDYMLSPISPTP